MLSFISEDDVTPEFLNFLHKTDHFVPYIYILGDQGPKVHRHHIGILLYYYYYYTIIITIVVIIMLPHGSLWQNKEHFV